MPEVGIIVNGNTVTIDVDVEEIQHLKTSIILKFTLNIICV